MAHLLAISGSLRAASLNTELANVAARLAPPGVTVEVASLHGIPLYDEEVESAGIPAAVAQLAERVRRADGVLIVTPEYNYSIPGVLKNALDWLSRLEPPPLADKPTGILSASPGIFGGIRAQDHLRQVLFGLDAWVLNRPQVIVNQAESKLRFDGRITDEVGAGLIRELLAAVVAAGRAKDPVPERPVFTPVQAATG